MMQLPYFVSTDLVAEVTIPENGILSRTLYNDDQVKVIVFGFAAGQELSAHTAPMPAQLHFLKGDATLTLGSDTLEATAGTFAHMTPNLNHGIVARTPVIMLLVMMKAARVAS